MDLDELVIVGYDCVVKVEDRYPRLPIEVSADTEARIQPFISQNSTFRKKHVANEQQDEVGVLTPTNNVHALKGLETNFAPTPCSLPYQAKLETTGAPLSSLKPYEAVSSNSRSRRRRPHSHHLFVLGDNT